MQLIDRLEQLEKAPLGNARLAKIKEMDTPELRELFNYALSGDITFGLKQVPEASPAQVATLKPEQWWPELTEILEDLADRSLTGNDAKARVASFLGLCSPNEAKWAERIIKQDLRLSVGAKDINKMIPGTIRVFEIPLAKPFKELKSLKGAWYIQPKMDGGRVVARLRKNGGKVQLFSRTGKEWKGFESIKEELGRLNVKLNFKEDHILDGEVVVFKKGRMDFQAVQKLFHAEDRTPDGDLFFVAFDLCTMEEYFNPTLFYGMRFEYLQSELSQYQHSNAFPSIRIIQSQLVINPEQKMLDEKAVEYVQDLGCDGAIIRRTDTVVRNKKTSDITKVKPFEDGEAVVVGRVEGKGWLEGSLGTMVCQMLIDKTPVGPLFEIGTGEGLTKELRQQLWDDKKLVGSFVNLKYQRLSNDGVPVLPTYRAIRHPDDF